MRKSPFGREEFGSWGWHILIVFTLFNDHPSIQTTFLKCKKLQECEVHRSNKGWGEGNPPSNYGKYFLKILMGMVVG